MKPHLLTDSGKIYVVELPDKPCVLECESLSYCFDNCDKEYNYNKKVAKALSNKIEVHPDCVDEANELIMRLLLPDEDTHSFQDLVDFENGIKDNHPYLIEGLKVHLTTHLYEECQFECICSIEDTKQYAIISIEPPNP